MIPKVKTWKVTFYMENGTIETVYVDTINKKFAKWLANDKLRYIAPYSRKITVGLIRKGNK